MIEDSQSQGGRFDQLARALAQPRSRRSAFGAGVAALVAGLAGRTDAAAQGFCIAQGLPCSMSATCCQGYCAPNSIYNPNIGVCTSGSPPASTPAAEEVPVPKTRTKYALKRVKVKLDCFQSETMQSNPTRAKFGTLSVLNNSAATLSIAQISIIGGGPEVLTPSFPKTVYATKPTDAQLMGEAAQPPVIIPTETPLLSIPVGAELFIDAGSVAFAKSNGSFNYSGLDYFWDIGDVDVLEGKKSNVGVRVSTTIGDLKAFCKQSKTQKYNKLKRKRQRRKNRR